MSNYDHNNTQYVTLGGGCFWCIEAIFQRLIGVIRVRSGFAGSSWEYPTYQDICSGMTGHAEVCQIEYDPAQISYETILNVFFHLHDPTTKNRQGNDIGSQYRSIILYHNEQQKEQAMIIRDKRASATGKSIVTELVPLQKFYKAEDYHQNYFNTHLEKSYCKININPKIKKLEELFEHLYKKHSLDKI